MKTIFTFNNVVVGYGSSYSSDVSVSYSIAGTTDYQVPDTTPAGVGWLVSVVDGQPVFTEPAPVPPTVSAIQYKMLFTSAERIAAKASTDPVVMDLQELLNDPRTTSVDLSLKSISDALDYMTSVKLLAPGRKAEILTGVPK